MDIQLTDDGTLAPSGPLGSRTSVSLHEVKFLGEFKDDAAAERFIRERMDRERFWPNVWKQDDHGGYTLVTIESEATK